MRWVPIGFTATLCVLLPGCAVGPRFHAPDLKTPAAWKNPAPSSAPSDASVVRDWWKTFHDPVLDSLVERAAKANYDVRLAASRIVETRAAQGISEAALKPSVNTSDGMTRVRGGIAQGLTRAGVLSGAPQSRTSILTPFETNVFQLSFDASWELDFVGGVRRGIEAAKLDVRAAGEARNDALVTVLGEVGRTYMQLRGAQRRLAIVERNVDVQKQFYELTRTQAVAGLAPELDSIRAQAQLLDNEAGLSPLKASISQSIRHLSILLGETPYSLEAELAPVADLPPIPESIPVGMPSDLLDRRSDVRRAGIAIAAQSARVGVARSDLFPKFTLTGLAGRQANEVAGFTLGAGNYFSVGPGVRLPIFTAGRIRSNIRVQDARLEQAALLYEKAVLNALEEVEAGLSSFAREKERRAKLAQALRQSEDAVALTRELYAKGLGDFLSVLDAQRAKLVVEDELAQSDTNVSVNLVSLYKALGGGW